MAALQSSLFSDSEYWQEVKDGHPAAFEIFRRHYSYHEYRDGRRDDPSYRNRHLFAGPGEKIVLLSKSSDALLVWRRFRDASGQTGVCCAVFRNESNVLSSALLLDAERFAWRRWPGERLYTYVNPRLIKSSNPGYCFIVAGWQRCGFTKMRKLLILEKLPQCGVPRALVG